MIHGEKYDGDKKRESLRLLGEQINLTSRSDQTQLGSSSNRSRRPHSAAVSRSHIEQNLKHTRPKSADCDGWRPPFQWSFKLGENKVDEKTSIAVSHFTDSSSKLLQNLLEVPDKNSAVDVTSRPKNLEKRSTNSDAEKSSNYFSTDYLKKSHQEKFLTNNFENEMKKKENLESLKIQQWLPEVTEEKTVRFLGNESKAEDEGDEIKRHRGRCNRRAFLHHHCHHIDRHSCRRHEYESPRQEAHSSHGCLHFQRKDSRVGLEPQGGVDFAGDADEEVLKITDQFEVREEGENEKSDAWLSFENTLGAPEDDSESALHAKLKQASSDYFPEENELRETSENAEEHDGSEAELEEMHTMHRSSHVEEKETTSEWEHIPRVSCDSTYEEMIRLLQSLEEEDSDKLSSENRDSKPTSPPAVRGEKIDHLSAVYSYLEEVEKEEEEELDSREKDLKQCSKGFSSPRLEELLNKNSVELAHEVLSLKIQAEDQRKGIKLLRETLAEAKAERRASDLEHQEALHRAGAEAEALVRRHQRFIKQLLNEKKNLNETVSKLVQDLKSGEERHKRNIKVMEEKHAIEVKRAKEAQAVADKIKREKWMESKTQKIKEMTVKGLEPELSRMAARQQEEVTELRNLHRAELEAVELRAARRTSDLMDELRAELTKEKEHAIGREAAALRASMEKEFEEERNKLQNYCQTLKDRLRREEERLSNREVEFHQKLIEHKQEAEKERQKVARDHQDKLEDLRRRHQVELKNLKESLEAEKEIWANNYKKQQTAKFFERETELHQQYKRERDRDIEMIIETFEKESAQIQLELNLAGENKLKRLKDKLEAEIREVEASEAALKGKLSEAKSHLLAKEDYITELNSRIRQLQGEAAFLRKSCEEMTSERANLKEVIRGEFEKSLGEAAKEKEAIEKEITLLKEVHAKELSKRDQINLEARNEMQKELARVYTRFKSAVNKKEKIIESLRDEIKASNQRCQRLELMLDRQRRNLLL